ncbi:hypothetical protein ABEB36_009527 [Hypothenemus hampei]|uniref:Uncharacterized protein n=1 Tax=Hypothenemus hampei TaxID=57062 RepID=A0ABD1EGV2_HYPHA
MNFICHQGFGEDRGGDVLSFKGIAFIRDRENPFEMLDNIEFKRRFRLNKNTVTFLLQYIGPTLQPRT